MSTASLTPAAPPASAFTGDAFPHLTCMCSATPVLRGGGVRDPTGVRPGPATGRTRSGWQPLSRCCFVIKFPLTVHGPRFAT
jgi:hypothetical protein